MSLDITQKEGFIYHNSEEWNISNLKMILESLLMQCVQSIHYLSKKATLNKSYTYVWTLIWTSLHPTQSSMGSCCVCGTWASATQLKEAWELSQGWSVLDGRAGVGYCCKRISLSTKGQVTLSWSCSHCQIKCFGSLLTISTVVITEPGEGSPGYQWQLLMQQCPASSPLSTSIAKGLSPCYSGYKL